MNGISNSKNMNQKQIIRELKCLVAKQQKAINQLIEQLQSIKRQRQHWKYEIHQKNQGEFSNSTKNDSKSNQDYHNKKVQQISLKNQIVKYQEPYMKSISIVLEEFQTKILDKYQNALLVKSSSKQSLKQQQYKKIPSPTKNKGYKMPSSVKEKNLTTFSQAFPIFLKRINNLLKQMQSVNLKSIQKSNLLENKIKQQEKTLNDIMMEYERNILGSQEVQKKLIQEIQTIHRIGLSHKNKQNNFDIIEYRKQLYDM